uniref:Ankyrin repeat-containing protein n=1 Tax=Trepomonas sp. PC1 TaxID=1076344 RepID=A0A146KBD7_9EUKA|eukprot:JAP93857.1 Ankyrin repeat-containing protein [Trepomonas sp. PC1]
MTFSSADYFQAIQLGDVQVIQQRFEKFLYQRDQSDRTGLMLAASLKSTDHLRIMSILAKEQKIQNNQGLSALMFAAMCDNADAARMLLEEKGLTDQNGFNAYFYAYQAKSLSVLKVLNKNCYKYENVYRKEELQQKLPKQIKTLINFVSSKSKVSAKTQVEQIKLKPRKLLINDFPDWDDQEFYLNDLEIAEELAVDQGVYAQFLRDDEQFRLGGQVENAKSKELLAAKYGWVE